MDFDAETIGEAARACLAAREPDEKIALTRGTLKAWGHGKLRLDTRPVAPPPPGIPAALELVAPGKVPRRRGRGPRAMGALVHAVAHIEYNAINLAWDCVARFSGLPRAFYEDWVRVAGEEGRHFEMLSARLRDLDMNYGDLPAHGELWVMAEKTAHDLAARMAMVPRVLEARGLDVTPAMIERVRAAGDEITVGILEIILREEIGHVAAGSRWFRFACERSGLNPDETFADLVGRYLAGPPKRPFSIEYRRLAGFSEAELSFLETAADKAANVPAAPLR